jgi:hypothetical protein
MSLLADPATTTRLLVEDSLLDLSVRFGAARELQVLWKDGEWVLCRGPILDADADRHAVLVLLPAAPCCPADVDLTSPTIRLQDMRDDMPARRKSPPDRPLRPLTCARARRTAALPG